MARGARSVADFQALMNQGRAAISAMTDVREIVSAALGISRAFSAALPVSKHAEYAPPMMNFLGATRRALTRLRGDLHAAFLEALAYEAVVPRLYVLLCVAGASMRPGDSASVVAMLPGVGGVSQAMLLRRAALGLIPSSLPVFRDLALRNVVDGLDMLGEFMELYRDDLDVFVEWIGAHVTAYAELTKERGALTGLCKRAQESGERAVMIGVQGAVMRSVGGDLLAVMLCSCGEYMESLSDSDGTREVLIELVSRANTAATGLAVLLCCPTLVGGACAALGELVLGRAMAGGEDEVVRECARRWPSDAILSAVLDWAGVERFHEFVERVPATSSVAVSVARQAPKGMAAFRLCVVGARMRAELRAELINFARDRATAAELLTAFAPPMELAVDVAHAVAFAFARLGNGGAVIGLLSRVADLAQVPALAVGYWPVGDGDLALETFGPLGGFARRLLLRRVPRLRVCEGAVLQLFGQLVSVEEIEEMWWAVVARGAVSSEVGAAFAQTRKALGLPENDRDVALMGVRILAVLVQVADRVGMLPVGALCNDLTEFVRLRKGQFPLLDADDIAMMRRVVGPGAAAPLDASIAELLALCVSEE